MPCPAQPRDSVFILPSGKVGLASTPRSSLFSQVNHTVALSTIGESNYHFGVTYVGTKQLSPTEVRSLIHRIFLGTNVAKGLVGGGQSGPEAGGVGAGPGPQGVLEHR
jgi:hypothetical protein